MGVKKLWQEKINQFFVLFSGVNQIDSHFRECKLLHFVLSLHFKMEVELCYLAISEPLQFAGEFLFFFPRNGTKLNFHAPIKDNF